MSNTLYGLVLVIHCDYYISRRRPSAQREAGDGNHLRFGRVICQSNGKVQRNEDQYIRSSGTYDNF